MFWLGIFAFLVAIIAIGTAFVIDESGTAIAKQTGIAAGVQQCLDLVKAMGKGEPGLCMNGSGVALTKAVG